LTSRFDEIMKISNIIASVILYSFLFIFTTSRSYAQSDTLVMKSGELILGDIKKMERGVLTIETSYSDSDFLIEWNQINQLRSTQSYLVTLSDGRRFNATMNSIGDGYRVQLEDGEKKILVAVMDLVEFKPIDDSFWDKISANIDLGYNVTKANNLVQFNTRAFLGYLTRRWEASGSYNTVFSSQDSVANTKRMDANLMFKLFLPKDWFVSISNDFLQNDEQNLQLRSTTKLAVGNYVIHSNQVYFAVIGGVSLNNETFTENSNPTRTSSEALAGLEFNMFNTGDLSILTNVFGYPNLSEGGRFRVDFKFDIKYDLPLDFYIKAGTTVNYDNQPVAGGSELDYVIQTGFGWEW
jgi:Protein of unknown function, DUF481